MSGPYADLLAAELAAGHAACDAKERALDEHGYGKPGAAAGEMAGLADFIPALRLYSDELGALRKMRAALELLDREMRNAGDVDPYWLRQLERVVGIANGEAPK